MTDIFEDRSSGLESPGSHAASINPSDTTDLATASRALYVGGPGNLQLTLVGGTTITLHNLSAGWVPLRTMRVHASGTTATDIVAVW